MAVKEACMRQNTQLEWEILEAEEEEWAEVTMAPPADEPRPARRQWLAKLLGSVALLATLTGVVGYRLVQDAEAAVVAGAEAADAVGEIVGAFELFDDDPLDT